MILGNALGLLLLLAIPVIIVLHLFRQERRRQEVSSLYLWKEISDQQSRRVRPRLLRNINLLLQILATALAALALAQPSIRMGAVAGSANTIVLIDDSASMQAPSGGVTRMDLARNRAREIIGRTPRSSRVLLMTAGPRPRVLEPFTTDRSQLYATLAEVEATDGSNEIRAALELASALAPNDETDLILVTDGAIEGFSADGSLAAGRDLQISLVGEPADNVAITSFELRTRTDQSAVEILAAVANFGSSARSLPVRITADGEAVASRTFDLAAGEERLFAATIDRRRGTVYEARIEENEDSLRIDDSAFAATAGDRAVRVQLVTPGNLFLESLLSVYPNLDLEVRASVSQTSAYDLLILDRVPAPSGLRGGVIAIDTALPDGPFSAGDRVEVTRAVSSRSDHPVTQDVRLDLVSVREAVAGELTERATVLASAGEIPLIYLFRRDRLSLIATTFSLEDSDIALRGSFPVLFHNMLQWLAPVSPAGDAGYTSVGEEVSLYVPPGEDVVLIDPLETPLRFTPQTTPFRFDETYRVGVYEVRGVSYRSRFAVSLADRGESNLTPRIAATVATQATESSQTSAGQPVWQWLALLALLALALDWIIWARRH